MSSPLAASASPYLRAHADNPVAWFAWGEAAFDEARRRDVPVMVSIGYSTCHWCHVMARESFQDAATAAVINENFVAIKVDREEHPEVDAAYMAAASAFTRNLGWPLTVFTTPAGRAFFAGTYWPPEPRPPMASFRQVLEAVTDAWTQRRDAVEQSSAQLVEALAQAAEPTEAADAAPGLDALVEAARVVIAREDREFGGFAEADAPMATPKFPVVPVLRFLQAPALSEAAARYSASAGAGGTDAGSGHPASVATRALDAMAASDLRDPVDGGFFRYATNRDWSVPHYERMLTDNAGLIDVALDADRPKVAAGAAEFIVEVLQQPAGGFAAAQDSESWIDGERSEGGYYARDAAARAPLEPPAVDGKVITGWNGMAVGALARAGVRLGRSDLLDAARRAADAVLETNVDAQGRPIRASLDEIASRAPATLEDYALLAEGLVALACATGEVAYAEAARTLVGSAADAAPDPVLKAQGIAAPGGAADGDHPSGRAALAAASLALWRIGAGDRHRALADQIVREAASAALAQPFGHASLLRVATELAVPPRQVVVVTDDADAPLAVAARGLRADTLAIVTPAQARAFAEAGFELFEGKAAVGAPTAYDCFAFTCRLPVTDPADLAY